MANKAVFGIATSVSASGADRKPTQGGRVLGE